MRQGGFKILARCLAFISQPSSLSLSLLRNWHRNSKVSQSRKPVCRLRGTGSAWHMQGWPPPHGSLHGEEIDSGMSNELSMICSVRTCLKSKFTICSWFQTTGSVSIMSHQKWNHPLFGPCCPLFHIWCTSCFLTRYTPDQERACQEDVRSHRYTI